MYILSILTRSSSGSTLQDVRLELAREEASNVSLGREPRHKISMATFLMTGFDLEDNQYVFLLIIA